MPSPIVRKYKTKKEKCAAVSARTGKLLYAHTAACRKSRSAGIHSTRGVRRPAGNPLVVCQLTPEELMTMTIPMLKRYASRNGIDLSNLDRPVKAEIINAILTANVPCDLEEMDWVGAHPQQATTAQLGAYLRTHGEPLPTPQQARCPYTTKTGKTATRRCKTMYVDMVAKLAAEKRPPIVKLERLTMQHMQPPITVVAEVPRPALTKEQLLPSGPGGQVIPVPPPHGPVVAQTILPEGVAEGAGLIYFTDEQGKTTTEAQLTKVTMAAQEGGRIRVDTIVVEQKQPQSYLSSVYTKDVKNANPTFLIDSNCAVDVNIGGQMYNAGDLVNTNTKRSAIVKNCTIIKNDDETETRDCEHGLIYIEQLNDEKDINDWKERLAFYQDYNQSILEYTLKVTAVWTCDSSKFQYNVGLTNYFGEKHNGSLVGFIAVEIPKGYRYMSLRDFMSNIKDPSRYTGITGFARSTYNWFTNLTWNMVESRYIESCVPDLLELMYTSLGVGPNTMTPDNFGVLIKDGVYMGDKNNPEYPYSPLLLPGIDKKNYLIDPLESPYGAQKLTLDRNAIFSLVQTGFTVDGMKSSYRPAPGFLKTLTYVGAGAVLLAGGAYLATAYAPTWVTSLGISITSGVATISGTILTSTIPIVSYFASIVGSVATYFPSASSWAAVSGPIATATKALWTLIKDHPWATSALSISAGALVLGKAANVSSKTVLQMLTAGMALYGAAQYGQIILSVMNSFVPAEAKAAVLSYFAFAPSMAPVIAQHFNLTNATTPVEVIRGFWPALTNSSVPAEELANLSAIAENAGIMSTALVPAPWHKTMTETFIVPLEAAVNTTDYVRTGIYAAAGAVLMAVTAGIVTKHFRRRDAAHLAKGKDKIRMKMLALQSGKK